MAQSTIIGLDLAKSVFHAHGASENGAVVFRKKLARNQVLPFLSELPKCTVAMEACATAHGWARDIEDLGHSSLLVPPQYVKPYVKRQKNDTADAEAIAEAASRPTMRFVEIKSEDQQISAMAYRTRQMFVGQRTQSINALRAHLAEHGVIAATNRSGLKRLSAMVQDQTAIMPDRVREMAHLYVAHIAELTAKITEMTEAMKSDAKASSVAKRLQTMPGVGLQTAMAIETFAPDFTCFARGRDFSAWLGLVPKQNSTAARAALEESQKWAR